MNHRQRRFADEYLIDLNAEQAAIRAGYSERYARGNAHKLVAKGCIKDYITEQLEKIHSEKIADVVEVMIYLTSVMRGEQTEQTLRLIGEGYQEITDINISAKERLKAAELIGKRYGMFTDKLNVEGSIPVVIVDDLEEDDEDDEDVSPMGLPLKN